VWGKPKMPDWILHAAALIALGVASITVLFS
jgi:hypothetical protein